MAQRINFVSQRKQTLTKKQQQDRKLVVISGVIFVITALCSIILFAGYWYLSGQVLDLKSREDNLKRQIISDSDKEESLLILSNKLKVLSGLILERQDKQAAIEFFSNIFGPDVLLREISYDNIATTLFLKVESKDIFVLRDVANTVASERVTSRFVQVNSSDIRRTQEGKYSLVLTIPMDQKVKK